MFQYFTTLWLIACTSYYGDDKRTAIRYHLMSHIALLEGLRWEGKSVASCILYLGILFASLDPQHHLLVV